jgi:hypothetical protein
MKALDSRGRSVLLLNLKDSSDASLEELNALFRLSVGV